MCSQCAELYSAISDLSTFILASNFGALYEYEFVCENMLVSMHNFHLSCAKFLCADSELSTIILASNFGALFEYKCVCEHMLVSMTRRCAPSSNFLLTRSIFDLILITHMIIRVHLVLHPHS